jgi:hypothetical protein
VLLTETIGFPAGAGGPGGEDRGGSAADAGGAVGDGAPAAAAAFNALLIARSNDLADQIGQVWASVTLADIDAGWQQAKAAAVSTVVRGQLVGAAAALLYHRTLLAAHDVTPSGPQIRPLGFAGQGSGKLGLSEVVDFAPIRVKQAIARGLPARQALTVGQAQLEAVADSELHEAARGVMDVAMNTEPAYRGYLRHPNPGACGRCLILANRFYRTNEGFERHPRCSCSVMCRFWWVRRS